MCRCAAEPLETHPSQAAVISPVTGQPQEERKKSLFHTKEAGYDSKFVIIEHSGQTYFVVPHIVF
jgi:hypothetical protein